MKIMLAGGLILALAVSISTVTAQDQAPDAAAAQAAFLESLKLAPEHAHLKKYLGKWTAEMKSFYEDPAKPTVSKGTATFIALLGGRYIQQTYQGEFAGIPFEGIGITGFDKTKKKFVGSWIDNFETGIMTTEGTYDEKTKTMTEHGVSRTPQGEVKMRNVTKHIDADTMKFSMYMATPGGTENLGMEITYHRVK